MDLSQITDVTSAETELTDPRTGNGLKVFFTLLGPEHPIRKKYALDSQRKLRRGIENKGKVMLGDPADEKEETIEWLVDCTTGWRQEDKEPGKTGAFFEFEGALLEFSPANAERIYTAPKQAWIAEQIKARLSEREVFIKGSSTTSAPGSSGATASTGS